MVHAFLFLMVSLIAGWLATNFVEGRGYGALGDVAVGAIGSFIGSFIFDLVDLRFQGLWGNVFVAVVGALLFLYVVNFFSKDRTVKP